jgi:hypothetical protein
MLIKISPDGDKNCLLTLSGFVAKDFPVREILSFKKLKNAPRALRLDSILFVIQEKMGFNLWWWMDEPQLIMPLESRGYFDFEKVQSLHSPPGATGLGLSSFKGPKSTEPEQSFLLMLDMVKQ